MGKKRAVKKSGVVADEGRRNRALLRIPKKKLTHGVLHIESTYNNTKISLCEEKGGGVVLWATTGSLGFKGTKKSTPFAASKVGDLIADKAKAMGVKDVDAVIKGIGPGRDSALRAFANKDFNIMTIKDVTPVPHNGPKRPKARRV